ncbi:MAP kinase Pmk1 [Gonapodya sp. JEL0774]|nr:MAP kinase Pmk1 [Gonapodya sp. JEL0774]
MPMSSLEQSPSTSGPTFPLSDYVATRWYRAPEVFCDPTGNGCYTYTAASDMWSAGCVIAEMIAGKPVFMGCDAFNQLDLITDVTGFPHATTVSFVGVRGRHSIPAKPRRGPVVVLPKFSGALLTDLLDKILLFHQSERLTATEALRHPYFAALHVEEDEPAAPFFMDWKWEMEAETAGEVSEERLRGGWCV